MRMRLTIWAALFAVLADQVSKYVVVHAMRLDQVVAIDVFPPLLNFRYGENTGINFGLLDGNTDWQRWALIAFSFLVCAGVWLWVRRGPATIRIQVSAGLLIGGALGNVIDRALYGYVLDFLNMSCCGINNPFVFNVADIFVFAGAAGLILFDAAKGSDKNAA